MFLNLQAIGICVCVCVCELLPACVENNLLGNIQVTNVLGKLLLHYNYKTLIVYWAHRSWYSTIHCFSYGNLNLVFFRTQRILFLKRCSGDRLTLGIRRPILPTASSESGRVGKGPSTLLPEEREISPISGLSINWRRA